MLIKKISAAIALLLISAFVLTGCKDKANSSSDSSSAVSSEPSVSSDDSHTDTDAATPDTNSNTSSAASQPHKNNNVSSQPHLHAYKITVVQPTCTEDGYTLYKCSCGRWYTEKGKEKTGHKWKEWTVTVMPTASTEGKEERECTVCHEKETKTLEKTALATPAELSAELLELINGTRTENGIEKLQLVTDGALAKAVEYSVNGDAEKYNAELEALKPEHIGTGKLDGCADVKSAFEKLTANEEYKTDILNADYKYIAIHITVTDGKLGVVLLYADRDVPAEQ